MKRKIEYSEKALADMDEIYDYIADILKNPVAAQDTLNGLMDQVDRLDLFPESGSILELEKGLESGYRYVRYKNYIAFYRLIHNHDIWVDRVLYAKRDYMKLLFK
jgi:toxin ParE1/3/4